MTTHTGGCLCGQVRYAFDAERVEGGTCYCRDCQRATGSPMTTVTMAATEALKITGETRTYSLQSAADRTVTRHFCPICGSQLFTDAEMAPGARFIKCATLDNPSAASIQANYWLSAAPDWAPVDRSLTCFDENPSG